MSKDYVPAADSTNNVVMSDVIGQKGDAAAAGAVSTTESLMAYNKQNVGALITIDGYHDVPTADTTDNNQLRDVIGNKTDAAAAGAVSATESLMAYNKQNVGALITIDGYHDVPSQNSADNNQLRDVVGNKTDTTQGDSVYSKVLQVQQATGYGVGGATKSLTFSNDTGALNIFTVTGDVIIKIVAVCKTNVASAAVANMELGIAGSTDAIIATTVSTDIDADEIWHDASPDSDIEALSTMREYIISGGADVILTLSAQVDSGAITFYAFATPLSNGSSVAAA